MCQRALEGYEKALGPDIAASYIPALNTVYNLGHLFASQGDKGRARAMYLRALAGYQNVFGDDYQECQDIQENLSSLHISASERKVSIDATGYSTPIISQGMLHSNARRNTLVSKRHRLLQKLGWR